MKLIVGLGNPGQKYKNNRHNVGFQFVDFIIENLNSNVKAQMSKLKIVKTDCFMNQSGIFIKKLFGNWKLEIGNLIVVHDDLDIPLGKFKIQKGTGPKLHNGLESIENELETNDFWRVRIGVDNRSPENRINGEIYTLQDFSSEEKSIILTTFPKILNQLKITLFQ